MRQVARKENAALPCIEEVYSWKSLLHSYSRTQEGSRKFKTESMEFRPYYLSHIKELQNELARGVYIPGDYIEFKVFEPKERLIYAPRLRDKIVQFSVHKVLQDIYRPIFHRHSYACLTGRGHHRAAKQVQQNLYHNPGGWIVKLDIAKFFYSVDRGILKELLAKHVACHNLLNLLYTIVDSAPGEIGIPLGNVTSQDFANIVLNPVDHFVTRFLNVKHYVRFMDDMVWVVETKSEAKETLERTQEFLQETLLLSTNEKTKIFPVRQGVNAYGFKIYRTHMEVREESKKGMKRRMKAMDAKVREGTMTAKEVQQCVNSWLGHAKHGDCYWLIHHIFDPYPYLEVT